MPLLDLWGKSRTDLEGKQVQQIIAIAGSEKLLDGGDASKEFRDFLSHVPSALLARCAAECLNEKFESGGLALQDVVNQVGRRLGFQVEDGRYRGSSGQSGYDGLWKSSLGEEIIVEVKTTDAYRVALDAIAEYRKKLIQEAKVVEAKSSILIVVGRQDTGDLEAQIRGSRHAWDIRLISVDSLIRLMILKETVEDPQMLKKIAGVLVPQEFTRVDGIIDLVFSAAEEVRQDVEEPEVQEDLSRRKDKKVPQFVPVDFHAACIRRIEESLNRSLLKQTRATYSSPDGAVVVVCAVSRAHAREMYWYAFHPHQKEKLEAAIEGYVAYGCGSEKIVLLIPFKDFTGWLEGMWITQLENRFYWHVSIRQEGEKLVLRRKKGFDEVDLTKYLVR
ncbi:MAG: hypothetical protein HOP22_13800 [Nitrospiraceae bacterium]|nr:hypothetical protein [Nitrospiraceae bacterium]